MDPMSGGAVAHGYGTDGTGDANAALAELDQGLRCGRLGEQSEAIVRFPRLFAKYPFPILINSALLKLADIFRQSGNFTKLCVLRVIQQSERHLDKITNVDEFLKRISTVLHSNDPAARALTLRLLGSVAVIIPERKQVHHSVRNALDSHDSEVELEAAIYAAKQFSSHSESFSVNVCTKIAEMIKDYSSPVPMKLKLMSIFQNMKKLDSTTAVLVRETCIELLQVYPSQDFVLVTLHTLTLLSAHALVDVPDQVELLLNHLNNDPRKAVKKQILQDLRYLAGHYAHLWSEENVHSTISFALDGAKGAVLCGALDILGDLLKHTSIEKFKLDDSESPMIQLCHSCGYSRKATVAARGAHLLTLIAKSCVIEMHQVEGLDITGEANMAIEALFLLVNSGQETPSTVAVLKQCLQSVVMLCKFQPEACDQFVDIVGGLLHSVGQPTMLLLVEVLAALGNLKQGVLNRLLPDICNLISDFHQGELDDQAKTIVVLLATLLLQSIQMLRCSSQTREAVSQAFESLDMWSAYRLARTASRFGHHNIAHDVYEKLTSGVSSEHLYFWLTGLSQVSRGEMIINGQDSKLRDDIVERLNLGCKYLLRGRTSIKASSTPARNGEFRLEYLRCRVEMLRGLCQVVLACNSLRTSPPPAIASSQAKQTHDDLQKCGRITALLRHCVNSFSVVGSMFGSLYETSFDADGDTLAHLQIMQSLCLGLGQWIEVVCLKSSLQGSIFDDIDISFSPSLSKPITDFGIDIQNIVNCGENVATEFRRLTRDPQTPAPITNAHTDTLLVAVNKLASEQICFPRLFFQSLQATNIKLAVTPQPRTATEPITVSSSQHLAVKVEGVITSSTSANFRQIKSIKLNLTLTLQAPASSKSLEIQKVPADCNQSLEQTVVPHNDFFTAQFLLPFLIAGTYTVVIETQLIDNDEQRWKQSGLNTVLNIKAFDDGQARMQRR